MKLKKIIHHFSNHLSNPCGIANGFYAIYSKIVDAFGQPYAELNWLFEVDEGNMNNENFRENYSATKFR
jgi:hypothetical protein